MSSKRKLTTLTYADKLKAIEAVKNGLKRKEVAAQFGICESTLSIIIKKKAEILKKQELGESLQCKRRKIAEFPNLEQCLFTWFKQCRNKNISVSGSIMKEKAVEFANSLKIKKFKASNGWLENFKKRHDLAFRKMCGESASLSKSVCQEDNNVPEEWNKHISGSNITFVTCDDEVVTAGTLTEEDILESVNNCIESDIDDDFNDEPQTSSTRVSVKEAKRAVRTVRSFIEQCNNIKDNVKHEFNDTASEDASCDNSLGSMSMSEPAPTPSSARKRRRSDERYGAMQPEPSANERDEYAVFGEYVAMKLRKVRSRYARVKAQQQIHGVLFNAEGGDS